PSSLVRERRRRAPSPPPASPPPTPPSTAPSIRMERLPRHISSKAYRPITELLARRIRCQQPTSPSPYPTSLAVCRRARPIISNCWPPPSFPTPRSSDLPSSLVRERRRRAPSPPPPSPPPTPPSTAPSIRMERLPRHI